MGLKTECAGDRDDYSQHYADYVFDFICLASGWVLDTLFNEDTRDVKAINEIPQSSKSKDPVKERVESVGLFGYGVASRCLGIKLADNLLFLGEGHD